MGFAVLMGFAGASFPLWVGVAIAASGYVNYKSGLKASRIKIKRFYQSSSNIMFLLGFMLIIGGFIFPQAPWKMLVSSSADVKVAMLSIFTYSTAIFTAPAFMWVYADKRKQVCRQTRKQVTYADTLCGFIDFTSQAELAEVC